MAVDDKRDDLTPTLANLETHKKDPKKSFWARLDEWGIAMLWSFIERDAGDRKFWIKVTLTMFFVTASPAIAIALYFFARDHGYIQ